jgi:hypothetical protein
MSQYEVKFDEESPNWNSEPEYNEIFLKVQENWFNDLLRTRGHVFLNEVYAGLGFDHTPAGAVIGWAYSKNKHIEFKVEQLSNGDCRIDFNVDGFILDRLGKRKSKIIS